MKIQFKKEHPDASIPTKAHASDACFDLYTVDGAVLGPGERQLFNTGLSCKPPEDYALFIRDRSGLAAKKGIHVLAGTVDNGYRGNIFVCLINLGDENCLIKPGYRIAQVWLAPVVQADVELVHELDETERGDGGFGSSGR